MTENFEGQPSGENEWIEARKVERGIDEKIWRVELEFVRRIRNETGGELGEIINRYTFLPDEVEYSWGNPKDREGMLREKKELMDGLVALNDTQDPGWVNEAFGVVKNVVDRVEERFSQDQLDSEGKQRLGDLDFNMGRHASAEDYGLELGDEYLEVHFPVRAVEVAKGGQGVSQNKSFAEVAKFIVEEHQNQQPE